jgi:hypothetical protein
MNTERLTLAHKLTAEELGTTLLIAFLRTRRDSQAHADPPPQNKEHP